MVNIYNEQGYPDFPKIREQGCPFILMVGGRGTGKTYGALYDVLFRLKCKFVYLRRTDTEMEVCMHEELNPFRRINHDHGTDYQIKKDGKVWAVKNGDETAGIGLTLAGAAKVKGMDAYDVKVIVFDEFIRDRNTRRTIKDEAKAFFDIYETINRNRELEGEPPVLCYLLANSTDSANPLFVALNLVSIAERKKREGKFPAIYKNTQRGIFMIDFGETNPISKKKANTALYRLTGGCQYADMALRNDYAYNDPSRTASRPLREYNPVVFVGELGIYKHKSRDLYYCCGHKQGGAPTFGSGHTELTRFSKQFAWVWFVYLSNKIEFESYSFEALLTEYFSA